MPGFYDTGAVVSTVHVTHTRVYSGVISRVIYDAVVPQGDRGAQQGWQTV